MSTGAAAVLLIQLPRELTQIIFLIFFVPALSIFQFKERQLYYFEDKLSKIQNPCRIHYFIRFFFKVISSYIEFDELRKIQLSLKLRHYE